MPSSIDAVVIGAGVVGLATARALATQGLEVLVVERRARPGEEISSRNSGVIHSGIYYPEGSLKARLCVRGRQLLYQYCAERQITYRRCGKLIVAQKNQETALQSLFQCGLTNGVTDLEWLSASDVAELEPEVSCAYALLSPSTGVLDVHEYLQSLHADIEAGGGIVLCNAAFESSSVRPDGFSTRISSDAEVSEIDSAVLVNAAGLNSVAVLDAIEGYAPHRHRMFLAKGNYFAFQGRKPFRHLVYPMPNEAGLGVHATLDLDGSTRFGPDVEWMEHIDYSVDAARAEPFYAAIREYFPALADGSLQPAYAGIRPKLVPQGYKAGDFVIEGAAEHGIAGLVNLLGIESPGLTSSLAIAEHVVTQLGTYMPVRAL